MKQNLIRGDIKGLFTMPLLLNLLFREIIAYKLLSKLLNVLF